MFDGWNDVTGRDERGRFRSLVTVTSAEWPGESGDFQPVETACADSDADSGTDHTDRDTFPDTDRDALSDSDRDGDGDASTHGNP